MCWQTCSCDCPSTHQGLCPLECRNTICLLFFILRHAEDSFLVENAHQQWEENPIQSMVVFGIYQVYSHVWPSTFCTRRYLLNLLRRRRTTVTSLALYLSNRMYGLETKFAGHFPPIPTNQSEKTRVELVEYQSYIFKIELWNLMKIANPDVKIRVSGIHSYQSDHVPFTDSIMHITTGRLDSKLMLSSTPYTISRKWNRKWNY